MKRPRPFAVRHLLARVLLRLSGWRAVGEVPDRAVLVGAPHTSNWDWVMTLLLAWHSRVNLRLLVKKEFFQGPLAPIMRATGAVELDRDDPAQTVAELVAESASGDPWLLALAAEGTRAKAEYWKSGFYRIAQETDLPITLAFLHVPSKTVGWGPTFRPSGNVRADMDMLRAFYADKVGFKQEQFTPPRLRNEPEGPLSLD